jgi:cobalt/nickel transport system permease protein
MHMADALLSPAVGGVFWVASAGLIGVAAKQISSENDTAKTPLMGVMGAFIFAAQMINFAIPGTGSSGHIGGGMLLTIILGPWRAFITLASVLVVQCLFFADGGLLALGCNIFNLAFFPAFIAYPFIFRKIAGDGKKPLTLAVGAITATVAGLQLGAFSVVIQTILSGSSDLPFTTFTIFMLPIHLAIGAVEGVVTWAVLSFVLKVQPSLISGESVRTLSRPLPVILTIAALLIGGALSYLASEHPDGLEWSMEKAAPAESAETETTGIRAFFASVQERLSFLPDYGFSPSAGDSSSGSSGLQAFGTSVSGIVGGIIVLITALGAGLFLRNRSIAQSKKV